MAQDDKKMRARLEALLFIASEPVSFLKLAKFLRISPHQVEKEIVALNKFYQESGAGLTVIFKGKTAQLATAAEWGRLTATFLNQEAKEMLSTAAREVLAIIAYRGPLTRMEIEQIRGVNCSFVLRKLAIRGLIDRKESPIDSRSYLYEVSIEFLKSLGLSSVKELPQYQELRNAEALKELSEKDITEEREVLSSDKTEKAKNKS